MRITAIASQLSHHHGSVRSNVMVAATALVMYTSYYNIQAFQPSAAICRPRMMTAASSQTMLASAPVKHSSADSFSSTSHEEELARMKEEVDRLRDEARRRVDHLEGKISEVHIVTPPPPPPAPEKEPRSITTTPRSASSEQDPLEKEKLKYGVAVEKLQTRQTSENVEEDSRSHVIATKTSATVPFPKATSFSPNSEADMLAGTHWKIMLNIGREPGTWMPKTWGISGERLLLNLELAFENQQLYDREEFLGGLGGANVCRVVHHELSIAPSMTEGSRQVRLNDGGWRIAKGEGPLGTDMLKFYIETEEEVRHQGGDVYCPPGRIYCSCGLFPIHRPSGRKDELYKEIGKLEEKYDDMAEQIANEGMFSMKRLRLSKDLFRLSMETEKARKQLAEVSVREPDRTLLRLSRKGDVGLTKEGGVCCKVVKGAITEYHILGRFSLAAVEPRNDDNEDDE